MLSIVRRIFLGVAFTWIALARISIPAYSAPADSPTASGRNGAVVNVRDFGAIGDGAIHPVSELVSHGHFLKLHAIRKLYPFVDSLDWTIDELAFARAKLALPPDGGTIYFPAGHYVTGKYPWRILRDNLRLTGDGPDRTTLSTAPRVAEALVVAPYRHGGWQEGAAHEYPFTADSGARSSDAVQLKVPAWSSDFSPGELVFIRSGANRYDQDYGEFNEVGAADATGRLRFRYPLSRDYTLTRINWAGEVAENFTIPGEGHAVVCSLRTGAGYFVPPAGTTVSIGENIFQVAGHGPAAIRLDDHGRGNAPRGTIVPAGTKVAAARAVIKLTRTVRNFRCERLALFGRRKVLNLSNTFGTEFTDCRFVRQPGEAAVTGGLTIDGDGGRFARFERCTIAAIPPIGMQFARSFGGVVFSDCTFTDTNVAFTEFAFDCEVRHCTFEVHGGNGLASAVVAGKSCGDLRFLDNRLQATAVSGIFDTHADIQSQKHGSEGRLTVRGNTIEADGVAQIFPTEKSARISIEDNRVSRR